MNYTIFLLPRAQKELDAFKGRVFSAICKVLKGLSENPRPAGTLKLTGEGGWRIRVGTYRILYRIDDKEKKIFVYKIRHRKEVYR